jgi:Holliday junction resolvase RusA-like endonuclease
MHTLATLHLPIPPSVNAIYRRGMTSVYKTQAAKDYADEVWVASYAAGIQAPSNHPVVLVIHFYPANPRFDLDNILKVLLDSLEGQVYTNDNQVMQIHATKHPADKSNPRVEVTIQEQIKEGD